MANRTIGTEIVLTGEKAFNDAMKGVNSNLKNLRTDMQRVSAEFDGNANSIEALTAKQKVLEQSVDQHRAKVDALTRMYERSKQVNGENSAATDKYRQQLNQAAVALLKEEKTLKQNSEALEQLQRESESAEQAVEDLSQASDDLTRHARNAGNELEDMAQKADKSERSFSGVAGVIGSVGSAALEAGAAVVALAAGLGTAGVTALVSFANEAAEAARAAEEAGEVLTESQKKWLSYANQLEKLNSSSTKAKNALALVLLPALKDVSEKGAQYLQSFAQSMEEAGSDTSAQARVLSRYTADGISMVLESLPEYAQLGGTLLNAIKDGFREAYPELSDTGVELLFEFLQGILDGAPEAGKVGEDLFYKFLSGLEIHGPDLAHTAADLLGKFSLWLIENAPELVPVAGSVLMAFANGLIEYIPELGDVAGDMIVALGKFLTDPEKLADIAAKAWEIGKHIAKSIWDGLVEIWNDLTTNFPNLVNVLNAGANGMLGISSPITPIPGAASGLDYVPYDNYLIRLHKGEKVLTAAEAAAYRSGQSGQTVKQFNLTIHTQSLSKEELDMIVSYVNGKLGDDL